MQETCVVACSGILVAFSVPASNRETLLLTKPFCWLNKTSRDMLDSFREELYDGPDYHNSRSAEPLDPCETESTAR